MGEVLVADKTVSVADKTVSVADVLHKILLIKAL
jgi:hypothetical protein